MEHSSSTSSTTKSGDPVHHNSESGTFSTPKPPTGHRNSEDTHSSHKKSPPHSNSTSSRSKDRSPSHSSSSSRSHSRSPHRASSSASSSSSRKKSPHSSKGSSLCSLGAACTLCSQNYPKTRPSNWLERTRITLQVLLTAQNGSSVSKTYFDMDSEIVPFIEAHWNTLVGNNSTDLYCTKDSPWKQEVLKHLRQGSEFKQLNSKWTRIAPVNNAKNETENKYYAEDADYPAKRHKSENWDSKASYHHEHDEDKPNGDSSIYYSEKKDHHYDDDDKSDRHRSHGDSKSDRNDKEDRHDKDDHRDDKNKSSSDKSDRKRSVDRDRSSRDKHRSRSRDRRRSRSRDRQRSSSRHRSRSRDRHRSRSRDRRRSRSRDRHRSRSRDRRRSSSRDRHRSRSRDRHRSRSRDRRRSRSRDRHRSRSRDRRRSRSRDRHRSSSRERDHKDRDHKESRSTDDKKHSNDKSRDDSDRHRDRSRDRDRDKDKDKDRDRSRDRDRDRDRNSDKDKDRDTDRQKYDKDRDRHDKNRRSSERDGHASKERDTSKDKNRNKEQDKEREKTCDIEDKSSKPAVQHSTDSKGDSKDKIAERKDSTNSTAKKAVNAVKDAKAPPQKTKNSTGIPHNERPSESKASNTPESADDRTAMITMQIAKYLRKVELLKKKPELSEEEKKQLVHFQSCIATLQEKLLGDSEDEMIKLMQAYESATTPEDKMKYKMLIQQKQQAEEEKNKKNSSTAPIDTKTDGEKNDLKYENKTQSKSDVKQQKNSVDDSDEEMYEIQALIASDEEPEPSDDNDDFEISKKKKSSNKRKAKKSKETTIKRAVKKQKPNKEEKEEQDEEIDGASVDSDSNSTEVKKPDYFAVEISGLSGGLADRVKMRRQSRGIAPPTNQISTLLLTQTQPKKKPKKVKNNEEKSELEEETTESKKKNRSKKKPPVVENVNGQEISQKVEPTSVSSPSQVVISNGDAKLESTESKVIVLKRTHNKIMDRATKRQKLKMNGETVFDDPLSKEDIIHPVNWTQVYHSQTFDTNVSFRSTGNSKSNGAATPAPSDESVVDVKKNKKGKKDTPSEDVELVSKLKKKLVGKRAWRELSVLNDANKFLTMEQRRGKPSRRSTYSSLYAGITAEDEDAAALKVSEKILKEEEQRKEIEALIAQQFKIERKLAEAREAMRAENEAPPDESIPPPCSAEPDLRNGFTMVITNRRLLVSALLHRATKDAVAKYQEIREQKKEKMMKEEEKLARKQADRRRTRT